MNCTDGGRWADEIAAYALGALEPDEVDAVERHLESCEHCRQELRWLGPAVRALPDDVERVEPPARLREAIVGQAREEARQLGTAPRRRGLAERLGLRRPSGRLAWQPLAALALVALAVVAFAGYELGSDGGGGGASTYVATGTEPGLTARLSSEDGSATLALSRVQPLPEGRVLQAWVQRGGVVEPVPALFAPDEEGEAETTIADMDGVEAVLVTREPTGGSEAPTSAPIVRLPIGSS